MSIYSSSTSTPDLDSYANRIGQFVSDGLSFQVKVVKARLRFGHLDLLIVPAVGSGERWVEQHRVALDPVQSARIAAIAEFIATSDVLPDLSDLPHVSPNV